MYYITIRNHCVVLNNVHRRRESRIIFRRAYQGRNGASHVFPQLFPLQSNLAEKRSERSFLVTRAHWEWTYSLLLLLLQRERKEKGALRRPLARDRLSDVSYRMTQRWTRVPLCAENRHSMNVHTCASLSFCTRRCFKAFCISSIDGRKGRRLCTHTHTREDVNPFL